MPVNIPVLLYHRLVSENVPEDPYGICLHIKNFEQQLQHLSKYNIKTLTFNDLGKSENLKLRSVILTFDDGYRDNYELLLPMLIKYNARAVIFVLADQHMKHNCWRSSRVAEAPLMDTHMMMSCLNTQLIEIGSHGWSHKNLTMLNDQELDKEVRGSRMVLEDRLGVQIKSFAYPGGAWESREREAVQMAGYGFGVAVNTRALRDFDDPYAVRRRSINSMTSMTRFRLKISSRYYLYKRAFGR